MKEVKAAGAPSWPIRWRELVQEASLRYSTRKNSEGRWEGRSEDENKEISPYDLATEEEYRISTNITIGQGCEKSYDVTLFTAAYDLTRND